MRLGLVVSLLALGLCFPGCIEVTTPIVSTNPSLVEQPVVRRIEVTINETPNGTPCRVTYPPDPEMRDLRWATGAEASFCHNMAQESLAAIEAKGWTCSEENSDAPAQGIQDEPGREQIVWLCSRG